MKTYARGHAGRVIGFILAALLLLPGLVLPFASRGFSATGGRQNIVVIPLHTAVGNAPQNAGTRVTQEMLLALARQPGVQVEELGPKSALLSRAADAMTDDAAKAQLTDQYKIVADPAASADDRLSAAGFLIQALRVDAVVYGVIDQYEYTDRPDPRQAFLHASITKVTLEKVNDEMKPQATPIVAIGKSRARNDRSTQSMHNDEAISSLVRDLSSQLLGNKPVEPPPTGEIKDPGKKKSSNTALLLVLGAALIAAAAGGGGGGGGTPPPVIAPPTAVTVTTNAVSGYPIIQWVPSITSEVNGYELYRDETRGIVSRVQTTITSPLNKLPVTDRNNRSTRTRGGLSLRTGGRAAMLIAHIDGRLVNNYVDTTAQDGKQYTYYLLASTPTSLSAPSSTASLLQAVNLAPLKVTNLAVALANNQPKVSWTAPAKNIDTSNVTDPGTFRVYRSTVLAAGTQQVTANDVLDTAQFSLVGTVTWTADTANYELTDTSAPDNTSVFYAVIARDAVGHFDATGNYPVVNLTTPVLTGIVVSAQYTSLVVVDQTADVNGLHPSLDPNKPSSTVVAARISRNGVPSVGVRVDFASSDANGVFLLPNGNTATTDSDGIARVSYRSGYLIGTATITAVSDELQGSVDLTMVNGLAAIVTLEIIPSSPASANGTVIVTDKNGNPVPDATVNLATDKFTLSATTVTTNEDGVGIFTLNSNGQTGDATVTATVAGVAPVTDQVSFLPQANPELISGNLKVGAGLSSPFTWLLKNAQFDPLQNTQVLVKVSAGELISGNQRGSTITLATSTAGRVSFTYKAPTTLGAVKLQFFNKTTNIQIGADVTLTVVIAGPVGLSADAKSNTQIDLTWGEVLDATGYLLQRSLDQTTWTDITLDPTVTTHSDTGLVGGTVYYYRIRATTPAGTSEWSDTVSTITFPDPPINVVAMPVSATEIDLTWDDVKGESGYYVERRDTTTQVFSNVSGTLPADTTSYADKNLARNTTYIYRIVAFNDSGSSTSDVVVASTFNIVPVQAYSLATTVTRLYYSTDPDDQLNDGVALETILTVTGYGDVAKTQLAVGAGVKLTTSKGSFDVTTPGQVLSTDKKSISGVLDTSGSMKVIFRGRPDDGITKGAITLPGLEELGAPDIFAQNEGASSKLTTNLPTLVGPPYRLTVTASNFNFPGPPPILFQDKTLTVTPVAIDMVGQPVLAGMPVWTTQSWTPYVPTAEPPYDYEGVQEHGNVRQAYGFTDDTGTVVGVGFASNYSGLYTVRCFALKRYFDKASLDTVTNLTASTQQTIQGNLLPCDLAGNVITGSLQVLNKTFVYYNKWSILTPIDFPRINCDGTMTSKIKFRGYDENSKPVLPDVPFRCTSTVHSPQYEFTKVARLEQDGTADVTGQTLYFNQRSESYVLSRGVKAVGQVDFTFDNTRPANNLWTATNLIDHYGPPLADINLPSLNAFKVANYLITGTNQDNTLKTHMESLYSDIKLIDVYGNTLPDGYVVYLYDAQDPNNKTLAHDVNGIIYYDVLVNGTATGPYHYAHDLGDLTHEFRDLELKVVGQEPDPNPKTSIFIPFSSQLLVRPVTAENPDKLYEAPQRYVLPINTDTTLNLNVFDYSDDPVFDGYEIKYRAVTLPNSPNPAPTTVIPLTSTDAKGATSVTFNTGLFPSWYKIEAYYEVKPLNKQYVLDSINYHVGLFSPTNLVVTGTTMDTASLTWVDTKNDPADLTAYRIEYSEDGTNWTAVNVPSDLRAYKLTGLKSTGINYFFRVKAYSKLSGVDVESLPSNVVRQYVGIKAPTNLQVDNFGRDWVTLSWSDPNNIPADVKFYNLEYSTDNKTWTAGPIIDAPTMTGTVTGLTPLTLYYFRVRASNTVLGTTYYGLYSTVVTATPNGLKAPNNVRITATARDSLTVAWDDPNVTGDVEKYSIDYSTDAGKTWSAPVVLPVPQQSYKFTTLVPYIQHIFRVRALFNIGTTTYYSPYSTTVIGIPSGLKAPTNLTAAVVLRDSITLTWTDPNLAGDVESFRVESSSDGGVTYKEDAILPATQLTYTYVGLAPTTTFKFRVRASFKINTTDYYSPYSNVVTQAPAGLKTPTNLRSTDVQIDSITVAWDDPNAAGDVELYRLEYSTDGGAKWTEVQLTPPTKTYTLGGLTQNTEYQFRVRTSFKIGTTDYYSPYTSVLKVTTLGIQALQNLTVTDTSISSISVSWNDPNAAGSLNSYRIEYSSNNFTNTTELVLNLPTATSTTITGLTAGTNYQIRARAAKTVGTNTLYSAYTSVVNATPGLKAPINLAVTGHTATTVSLSWADVNKAGDVTNFRIESSTDNFATVTEKIVPVGTTTTTVTGLTPDADYQFRIRAYGTNAGKDVFSPYSTPVAETPRLLVPTNLAVTGYTMTTVSLQWSDPNPASDVTQYFVEYSKDNFATTSQVQVNAPTKTKQVTGLTAGALYSFRVKAYKQFAGVDSYSQPSNVVTETPRLKTPTGLQVTGHTLRTVSLSWSDPNLPADITNYRVEYSSGGAWTQVISATTNCTVNGLTPGTTYTFRVRAYGVDGVADVFSPYSDTTTGMPELLTPTNLAVKDYSKTTITLQWNDPNPAADVTSYRIEQSGGGATTYSIITPIIAVLEYKVSGLTPGVQYTFRIQAYNDTFNPDAVSPFSNAVNGTPGLKAPTLSVTGNTVTTVSLAWTDSNIAGDVSNYRLEYSSNNGASWTTITAPLMPKNITVTGLTTGTKYQFRMRAYGTFGAQNVFSPYSNVVEETPRLLAPTNLRMTQFTKDSIAVAWDDPNTGGEVTDYSLEYSDDNGLTWSNVTVGVTSFTLNGAIADREYRFRVRAHSTTANLYSVYSNVLKATAGLKAPTNVTTSNITSNSITVNWTDLNIPGDVTNFRVEYSGDNGATWTEVVTTATSQAINGLTANKEYTFRVRAFGLNGAVEVYSGYSTSVKATTLP